MNEISSERSRSAGGDIPTWARLALAAVAVVAVGFVIWAFATGRAQPHLDEDVVRARIESWGVFAPIGFVLVMWLVQPFGVPGVIFMIPASLVWSAPVAIVLSWIGNMGASWLAFEVTRGVGRDWVSERIPERLHRFDERLSAGGVWPILLLRVLTGQLPAADWLLGVSSVRRRPFLVGTGLGILPGIVVTVVFGADLIGWLRDNRGIGLALLLFAIGRRLPRWIRNRRSRANDTAG